MAGITKLFTAGHLTAVVNPRHTDIGLIVCALVTGIVDSVAFENWGVFVGMQTGNTIILGLSTAGLPATQKYPYATTLVSLFSFLLGAYLTANIARPFALTRLKVISLFLVQFLLLVLGAALCTTSLVPEDLDGSGKVLHNIRILTALPPLAFQSGVQITTSRILGFNELPVNVLTSSYADLMGDPKLWTWENAKRNRRLGGMVGVLVGAIISAWMMKSEVNIGPIMWLAAGLKGVVVFSCWIGLVDEKAKEGGADA